MAASQLSEFVEHLRRAMLVHDGTARTDGQLLEDYLSRRDEAALAALVVRHGPMVWGVCRRVLCNYHDAEDAFQATFLVLARRAAGIVPRERVANWLFGVARQTALKARATAARRKGRERQVARMPEPAVKDQDLWRDLEPLLDEELNRLPDRYRSVLVLCDLEGLTRKETARQLGVPEGTVAGWLARARTMLAHRLTQRGLSLSGTALAAVLSQNVASAGVPTLLVSGTIKAATLLGTGQTATAGVISAQVRALMEGVLKAMLLTKLKALTTVLLVLGLLTFAGGLLTHQLGAGQEGQGTKSTAGNKRPADVPRARHQEKPERTRYEDFVELEHGGGTVRGIGTEKLPFAVVQLESARGSSRFAFCFPVPLAEFDKNPNLFQSRVVAVDGSGKRHQARGQLGNTVRGKDLGLITLMPAFDLPSDKIKSFVIQRQVP